MLELSNRLHLLIYRALSIPISVSCTESLCNTLCKIIHDSNYIRYFLLLFSADLCLTQITNFPQDIPCALKRLYENLPRLEIIVNEILQKDAMMKEKVYYKRLLRFLGYMKDEIIYFSNQKEIQLLHTCYI